VNDVSKSGKGLITHAVLGELQVEKALALGTGHSRKRGTAFKTAQIFRTEFDNGGSQTAKVLSRKFKRFHAVLNLTTNREYKRREALFFISRVSVFLSPFDRDG
jgi:hypothetical protein